MRRRNVEKQENKSYFRNSTPHSAFKAMADLRDAGLREGITEVIATTYSISGEPNAAPVGIHNEAGRYCVALYRGSKTLSNVKATMQLAANVTDDAVLFVRTLLDNPEASDFSRFHGFPVLRNANSWILFRCREIEERADYLLFMLNPLAVAILNKKTCAVNRGLNAVIEAAILASRYDIQISADVRERIKEQIRDYARIVERCGGRSEKEAMRILIQRFV